MLQTSVSMQELSENQQALYNAIALNELTETRKILSDKSTDFSGDAISTPMIEAVKAKRYRIMRLLFEHGVDLSRADNEGLYALHYAAYYNDRVATLLLCINKSPIDVKSRTGITPLSMAILNRHYDIVQILVDKGATVYPSELDNQLYKLPVVEASFAGHLPTMIYLSNAEAAVEIKAEHMYYAMCIACYFARKDIVIFLLSLKLPAVRLRLQILTPLMFAISNYNNDIVRLLLANGLDANEKDVLGYTPLMYAAYNNNPNAVEQLLSHGADPRAIANDRVTTVFTIAEERRLEHIGRLFVEE